MMLLGICRARLPVLVGTEVVAPEIVVALMVPEGRIATHLISYDGDASRSYQPLLLRLAESGSDAVDPRPIIMSQGTDPLIKAFEAVFVAAGGLPFRKPSTGLSVTALMARHIGSRLGTIGVAYRPRSRAAPMLMGPRDNPLTQTEVGLLISGAIAQHNDRLHTDRTEFALFDGSHRHAVIRSLTALREFG